jgi:hypothetical protein
VRSGFSDFFTGATIHNSSKGTITAKNGAFNLDNVPLDASITIST